METTYQIEGMTCEHCERRVQGEVILVDGVQSATADAAAATVTVVSSTAIPVELIREAVEEAGYELAHG